MFLLKKFSFVQLESYNQEWACKIEFGAQNNIQRKDLQPSHARTVDWCFLRGGPMSDGGAGVL